MKYIKPFEKLMAISNPVVSEHKLGPVIIRLKNIIESIKEDDGFEKTKIMLRQSVSDSKESNDFTITYSDFDKVLLRIGLDSNLNYFSVIITSNTFIASNDNSINFLEFLKDKFENNIEENGYQTSKFSHYLVLNFNFNEINNILKEITLEKYYLFVETQKYNL